MPENRYLMWMERKTGSVRKVYTKSLVIYLKRMDYLKTEILLIPLPTLPVVISLNEVLLAVKLLRDRNHVVAFAHKNVAEVKNHVIVTNDTVPVLDHALIMIGRTVGVLSDIYVVKNGCPILCNMVI